MRGRRAAADRPDRLWLVLNQRDVPDLGPQRERFERALPADTDGSLLLRRERQCGR